MGAVKPVEFARNFLDLEKPARDGLNKCSPGFNSTTTYVMAHKIYLFMAILHLDGLAFKQYSAEDVQELGAVRTGVL